MDANTPKKSNKLISIICVIVGLVFLGQCVSCCSDEPEGYKDNVRCSWCGKVVRSNGRNIHGTPIYNGGVLECDYCGHHVYIK